MTSSLRNRRGDTRSVLAKAIQKSAYVGTISSHLLAKADELRGDISSRDWKQTNTCIYCGLQASEKDHYGCAVVRKRANYYVDCPLNIVPSCGTCHRAGKDTSRKKPVSIIQWWLGIGCRLSKNHPQLKIQRHNAAHPDNPIDSHAVYRRLVAFDEFHASFAPRIPCGTHHRIATAIECMLDVMYKNCDKMQDHIIHILQKECRQNNPIDRMNTLYHS